MQHKSEYLDLRLCDNMQLMAQYPDKHFELAICDPPYGIGIDKAGLGIRKNKYHLTACELDSDYFAAMQTRIENHLKQSILF